MFVGYIILLYASGWRGMTHTRMPLPAGNIYCIEIPVHILAHIYTFVAYMHGMVCLWGPLSSRHTCMYLIVTLTSYAHLPSLKRSPIA